MIAIASVIDNYLKVCYLIGAGCIALIGLLGLYCAFLLMVDFALYRTLRTKRLFKVFLETMYKIKETKNDTENNNWKRYRK